MPKSRLQCQPNSSQVTSSVKNTCAPHTFRSRIVHNSAFPQVASFNWRLDFYKFKQLSSAEVLKRAISNDRANSSIQCTPLNNTTLDTATKPKDHKVFTKTVSLPVHHSVVKTKAYHNVTKNIKVSHSDMGIETKNRFHILQGVGDIVQPSLAINSDPVYTRHDMSPSRDAKLNHPTCINKVTAKASNNDVSDTTQVVLPNNCPLVDETTKYDLPVRIKDKTASYKQLIPRCPTLKLWDSQNKFGFIPLGDLALPSHVQPTSSNQDLVALHAVIKQSGDYNFMSKQIDIPSQLNPDIWDHQLEDYWDNQLPLLIRFGFPLDYDRKGILVSHQDNHSSAKSYPKDIQAYLEEEIAHNAVIGNFDQPPIENLHISAMMTREKANSSHRRVIIDLSFPHGTSVNSGVTKDKYLGTPFILKLPTIDTVTDQIKALGRGCMMYKVDISRAFRHIKLDPMDYDL